MKPATFLSDPQAILVKQSWPTIVSESFWATFYVNLFSRSPSYQLFFDRFARVPLEELRRDVHFLAHTARTGFAFDAAIGLILDEPEKLRRVLEDLGEKHRKYRLTAENFETVREVLMDLIEDRLKNEQPDRDALTDAWKACITSVIGAIGDTATTAAVDSF